MGIGLASSKQLSYERAVAMPILLKECPFCGDEAVVESGSHLTAKYFFVQCVECGAHSSKIFVKGEGEQADLETMVRVCYRWNLRTPSKKERLERQEEEIQNIIAEINQERAELDAERERIIKEREEKKREKITVSFSNKKEYESKSKMG